MLSPRPEKHLQRQLVEPILAQKGADHFAKLDPAGQRRQLSVASPHALSWTTGPNPWINLSCVEFRSALRWITLTPQRPAEYCCPFCRKPANMMGLHAVSCTVSGAAARGHYVVRDLHRLLWREAGFATEKERSPSAFPALRPADILIHNLFPARPAAVDFTIWTRRQDNVDELDEAVRHKRRMYSAPCESEGWVFKPWGADTFGGDASRRPFPDETTSKGGRRYRAKWRQGRSVTAHMEGSFDSDHSRGSSATREARTTGADRKG